MKFNNLKSKYIGWRNFNEEDYHYGRAYANNKDTEENHGQYGYMSIVKTLDYDVDFEEE